MGAKTILKTKLTNSVKQRLLRLNASAYMHSSSLIRLKIIEGTCPNCKQPIDDMLHVWYHCFVAEYAILLLHNPIFYNFGLHLKISPSLILVTEPSQLKDIKADQEVKEVILNLVLSLKNNIHLDFYGKKLFISPFSSRYHSSLLKCTMHGAFRACTKIYIKIPPANPKYLPSGEKSPTLKTLFEESLADNSYNYDVPRLIL